MGKMKELFMQQHYNDGVDLEREYLINDSLAKDQEYEEYLKLKREAEINILNTKIEVANAGTTRIEVHQQEQKLDREPEKTES